MKKITRRSFLAAAGLSAALALTACSSTSSSTAASSSAASEAASEAASSEASTQAIQTLEDLDGKTVGVQPGIFPATTCSIVCTNVNVKPCAEKRPKLKPN